MSGGHPVTPQGTGTAEQAVKFQIAVAVNAGVRRTAPLIGVRKFADDLFLKFLGEVKDMVGDSQAVGYADVYKRQDVP